MKPEWKLMGYDDQQGIYIWWCKGCGCLKFESIYVDTRTRYRVPRRERSRRQEKRGYVDETPTLSISTGRSADND